MAAACPGVDSQVLATTLDPLRTIFDDLGPDQLLRDIRTIETSETSTLCVETGQMPVLATEELSAVEKRQMSAAETG